ncbi:hypothetical protein [Streptomyces sp. BE20]|uniref:hypothetical protein n=1 Tax=Streptomyces sp. BE20 TaxID=3002525 RepID=UPI002E772581|nr:hypothetical protein [Streptomyces sp. BE20]
MAQVVASALATVVGALLASELGVYGTILGAAVVSVGATTGGAVFQHVFKRTGEQLREAVDRTAAPGQLANGLRQATGPQPVPGVSTTPSSTRSSEPPSAEWNAPRVVRARRRWTWKSYATVSALVFTLAMVPILAFELATGQPVSATVKGGSGTGTSLGGTVERKPPAPSDGGPSGGGPSSVPSPVPSPGATGGPGASPSAGKGGGTSERPSPGTSPSAGTGTSGAAASPSAGSTPDPGGSPGATPSARPSGESSAPSGGGASAGPSGGATPKPPAPGTAVVPPAATAPAAPDPQQQPGGSGQ